MSDEPVQTSNDHRHTIPALLDKLDGMKTVLPFHGFISHLDNPVADTNSLQVHEIDIFGERLSPFLHGNTLIPHEMIGVFLFLSQISLSFSAPQTIFCLIHTATPSHETRARTIYETWAQHCDDFLFFTDSKMNDSIPHIYYPLLHTRDHSWEKIRRVFKYVHDKVPKKYDWYYRADDDTYALMHNMRALLSNYTTTTQHYLGLRWNFFTSHGFNDGSSYILSRPTMEAFNEVMLDPERCPDQHRAEEDQELAKCLAHMEIYPEDIRDEFGSERIQHFHPIEQYHVHKDPFNRRLAYYPIMKQEDNFSSGMISFHHISPYEMRLMEYIFYHLDKP